MAWQSVPTFSDGAILTATQMNILSGDLSHLYDLLQAATPAMATHYANQNLSSTNNAWKIRYRHRYLHYRVVLNSGTCTNVSLYVNGTGYTLDNTSRTATYTYSGYVDVNAQSLTAGTIYTCYFTTSMTGIAALTVEYLIQAATTTI